MDVVRRHRAGADRDTLPVRSLRRGASGQQGLRTIYEVAERALTDSPADLLRVIEDVRLGGSGIALDDVGADWRSLALLPFIRPDEVKLDIDLVQRPLTMEGAIVGEAVRAYAAASGARIVAGGSRPTPTLTVPSDPAPRSVGHPQPFLACVRERSPRRRSL